MKLIFIAHMWCPVHNAGGETTVHAAMRAMVERGHEVTVVCKPHSEERRFEPYTFEGVKVVRPPEFNQQEWFRSFIIAERPDILLTHLDLTFEAMQIALDLDKPLVHFVHNSMQLKHHRVNALRCQLAVFNSDWVSEREKWQGPQTVLHPVVEPERYQCERGTKITLVNPTPGKGADTFYALSKALLDHEFLCVKSVYGEQIAVPNISARLHPNVETMEHTADIREALRKTKILLMPSLYESYGRVAVEAACAGIPSIVHPTEGLLESLGADKPDWIVDYAREKLKNEKTPTPEQLKGGWVSGAGIFCDRDDVDSWKMQAERLLTDEVYYRKRSDAALSLAGSLNPQGDYDRLEQALISTNQTWLRRNEVQMVKMWKSDRRIWETTDGKLVAEQNGRIPSDAVRLAAGIGSEIPEEVAIANGFIPATEAKAIEAPSENKAIASPEETKAIEMPKKTRKRTKAA